MNSSCEGGQRFVRLYITKGNHLSLTTNLVENKYEVKPSNEQIAEPFLF